jgi:arsenate reductase
MTTVLFACVHNAGRSQMAAALFNRLADRSRARAISAGTNPAPRVHPNVVEAMRERNVDLSGVTPRTLTDDFARDAGWLITMGCGDRCPVVPGARLEDWPLDDPHGRPLEEVRAIRDDIERRVAGFIAREDWGPVASIDPARPDDAPAILALLEASHLPTDGLPDHLATAIVARQNGRIVASAALEMYPDGALLRSVAVDPALRDTGLGTRLTEAALRLAEQRQTPAVYLLTTTADRFFQKFGFAAISRADVPASVRQSVEFTSACPASAIVMRKWLSNEPAQTINPFRTA